MSVRPSDWISMLNENQTKELKRREVMNEEDELNKERRVVKNRK